MADFASMNPAAGTADSQTAAEIERVHAKLQRAEAATKPGQTVVGGQLPAHLVRSNPQEQSRVEIKQEAEDLGYRAPELDDRTINYFMGKAADAEFVDRERWIAAHFDLSKPEAAAHFNKIYPDFLDRRERYARAKMSMQWQLFKITLRGPQSKDDIDFMYGVDAGKIDLVELARPVWEAPTSPTDAAGYTAGMFARPAFASTESGPTRQFGDYNTGDTGAGEGLNVRRRGARPGSQSNAWSAVDGNNTADRIIGAGFD